MAPSLLASSGYPAGLMKSSLAADAALGVSTMRITTPIFALTVMFGWSTPVETLRARIVASGQTVRYHQWQKTMLDSGATAKAGLPYLGWGVIPQHSMSSKY